MTIKTWQSRFDALPELHRTYEIAFLHMEKEIAELRAENEAVHARLAAAEHSDYGELRAALAESGKDAKLWREYGSVHVIKLVNEAVAAYKKDAS
jgi:hypothetical protein